MSVFILFTFCSISGTFKTFKFTSLFLRQKKKKKHKELFNENIKQIY